MAEQCYSCGSTEGPFRYIEGTPFCSPLPKPDCFRKAWIANGNRDSAAVWLRHAQALARKLGFDAQDRHAFTYHILKTRGHDAVSWKLDAEHPLTGPERAQLLEALKGAVLFKEMALANHREVS